jgi:hypothetical protein
LLCLVDRLLPASAGAAGHIMVVGEDCRGNCEGRSGQNEKNNENGSLDSHEKTPVS